MNFISREAVLAILGRNGWSGATSLAMIEALPFFPAPNPTEGGGRNVLGQTHDEFWDAVERADMAGELTPEEVEMRAYVECYSEGHPSTELQYLIFALKIIDELRAFNNPANGVNK